MFSHCYRFIFFFFNDTATTEIYTLSLHDALPISKGLSRRAPFSWIRRAASSLPLPDSPETYTGACVLASLPRSEEHTSELQSQSNLVCRLLLEKKKHSPSLSRRSRIQHFIARCHN